LARSIGYSDPKGALKKHTDKKDRIQLQYINHSIYINQQPQTLYLSEPGMYKLMLKSKMKKAELFSDWITNDVLPSIRKYGYYKMKKTYENQKTNLLDKINDLEKRNKIMANDMKKEKFPDGALVYIIDYSDEDTSVDGIFKLGKTDNLKNRKSIYDTHMLHKKPVACKEFTEKPLQLENCIRSMLYDYRYKNRKDFYICKLSEIKKAFKNCIKSIKNMTQTGGSNINMDIEKLKKKINKLDKNIDKYNKLM
jgi:prophage antirepressor-like protein